MSVITTGLGSPLLITKGLGLTFVFIVGTDFIILVRTTKTEAIALSHVFDPNSDLNTDTVILRTDLSETESIALTRISSAEVITLIRTSTPELVVMSLVSEVETETVPVVRSLETETISLSQVSEFSP